MSLNKDIKDVDDLYKNLVPIAIELVAKSSKQIDTIINTIKKNIDSLTNKEINKLMLQLSIEAYFFGQKKDHAALKQACAEALYKESFAKSYTTHEGTAAQRQNQSTLDNVDKQAVKLLFDTTSNLMKTKLDETHRMINVLNSVVISRNAEAKLNREYSPFEDEFPEQKL
jgi:hypothetical protein